MTACRHKTWPLDWGQTGRQDSASCRRKIRIDETCRRATGRPNRSRAEERSQVRFSWPREPAGIRSRWRQAQTHLAEFAQSLVVDPPAGADHQFAHVPAWASSFRNSGGLLPGAITGRQHSRSVLCLGPSIGGRISQTATGSRRIQGRETRRTDGQPRPARDVAKPFRGAGRSANERATEGGIGAAVSRKTRSASDTKSGRTIPLSW